LPPSLALLPRSLLVHPLFFFFVILLPPPPRSTLFPYTTLFRSSSSSAMSASTAAQTGTTTEPSFAAISRTWSRYGNRGERRFCRSEEHTSELQSRFDLVCRLLLEKKKTN